MNFEKYPWLANLDSEDASFAISEARKCFEETGAVTFPDFVESEALTRCIGEATSLEDDAFTTDGKHTPHLLPLDPSLPSNSVRNYEMRTHVASNAYDELPHPRSALAALYQSPLLRKLVAAVTRRDLLYLSDDPLGCCSINVFRPGYHHSFHFDESEFSTTLMLQEAQVDGTGLFQYTRPLRRQTTNDNDEDLALDSVAAVIQKYALTDESTTTLSFSERPVVPAPDLHTLEFRPGTLSIFSGSRSLHRVTRVEGAKSRLVAVLTFASEPGFRNSAKVQKLFWGRSA